MPIYKKVNKKFFKKWSPEMSYILGFFAADGYITINKRGGQFWCIQITDRDLLVLIKKIINSEHKIGIKKGNENNKNLYRLQIGSIEMCNDLKKLGYSENKTKNLIVPNIPNKYLSDFVRGYFDGDGNVWVGNVHKERKKKLLSIKTVFTSSSKNFIVALKERLKTTFNLDGSVIISDNYYRLQYSINGSLKLYKIMYNDYCIKSGLFLDRKKIVFDKFIEMRS